MSFPNYGEQFQGQQGPEGAGGPGAGGVQQQQAPMDHQMDESQGQFQGGNPGAPGSAGGDQAGGDSKTTLWMGELEPWIDESFVRSVWFGMGEQVNVKMIRDKFSGYASITRT
ncbi:hypothetical protein LTR16_009693 [Cryomyces antarcticus]|uniref:RRM domain-containing protein n=1 Tax=Cryomyces antarcticus TaxID=329879 RepID=A0ABR0M2N2_9PEZI|nr:hypothetical protein LTR16_009693 [Cryomyces antarcticus]